MLILCQRQGFLLLRHILGFYSHTRTLFSLSLFENYNVCSYKVQRLVSCSPSDIFMIVTDIEKYKEFVPFVTDSFVNNRDAQGLPLEAGLRVGWKLFDEKFVCALRCDLNKSVMAESVSHALFDTLYTEWTFQPKKNILTSDQDLCLAELSLHYRFKNPLYNLISSAFSHLVTLIMIKAFEERVNQLSINRIKRT